MENQKALSVEQSLPPRTELSAQDVLVKARALIEKPENWCQKRFYMIDDAGRAVAWCAVGALEEFDPRLGCAYEALLAATGCKCISDFNDAHTHSEVLAAFDRAIAECAA
jgi:hypothetical protein